MSASLEGKQDGNEDGKPAVSVPRRRATVTAGCLLVALGGVALVDSWIALWGLLVGIDVALVAAPGPGPGPGRPTGERN